MVFEATCIRGIDCRLGCLNGVVVDVSVVSFLSLRALFEFFSLFSFASSSPLIFLFELSFKSLAYMRVFDD